MTVSLTADHLPQVLASGPRRARVAGTRAGRDMVVDDGGNDAREAPGGGDWGEEEEEEEEGADMAAPVKMLLFVVERGRTG
jgi:hypothetical protein